MTTAADQWQPLDRVATGVPGLDLILHGGLFRGDMYLLAGAPGVGKTVLANQVCFEHVAGGGRAVYVTILAESHVRMLTHLQSFPFFRAEVLAETLHYFSAFRVLEEEGLAGLLRFLHAVVQEQKATLLVIDALTPIRQLSASPLAFGRFLHDLGAFCELAGCTTLLLSQRESSENPEHTTLDGIIDLDYLLVGTQAVRELQVLKFRGSAFLPGRHGFEINETGVTVYARTESRYATPEAGTSEGRSRLRFGIPRLDEMLGGGLLSDTTTLLVGPSGSGKTLLGLHFLANGARDGQRGLHFGFYETPVRLISKANQLGLGFGQLVAHDEVEVLWQAPLGNGLDLLAERLLDALARHKARRLFIDGLEGFQQAAIHPERLDSFLVALTNELRTRQVTTIVSGEQPDWPGSSSRPALGSFVPTVDSVIRLHRLEQGARVHRLLSILKQQESRHETAIREFTISESGLDLSATSESAETLLAGGRPSVRFTTQPGFHLERDAVGSDSAGQQELGQDEPYPGGR